MNTRAALYQRLMIQHHAAKSELQKLQEQLQASQGMSFSGINTSSGLFRYRILAFSGIALILIFWFAAAARDQPAIDALTAWVSEMQSMIPT